METLERYVEQVNRWLPPMRRRAAAQRLREDLQEILADADDAEDVRQRLRRFGRPPVVAARYAGCSHVIPGVLAPSYYVVMAVSFLGLFMVNLFLVIPQRLHGTDWLDSFGHAGMAAVAALPLAFSIVTLVFTALGYWIQRHPRSALPGMSNVA